MTGLLAIVLAFAAFAAAPAVNVRPLEDRPIEGRLTKLSASGVQIQTTAGVQSIPASQVMWVELPTQPAAGKPAIWIDLLDGSRIHASAYTAAEGKSTVTFLSGQELQLPTRSIHALRFSAQSPELAVQWREIASSMASGDTLVIRKTSTRTVEQGDDEPRVINELALDQVEGTVLQVTPDVVVFEVDGEKINVRREKLEGIVYYQPGRREFPAPLCRLTDAFGSQWLLKDVELSDESLAISTLAGLSFSLPLVNVAKIDFSLANVAFLADLEVDASSPQPSVSLQPAAMAYKFNRIFQLRSAPPLGADSFRIGGQPFDNGLSIHSPARLIYRVPGGFRKFHAVAGIDDSILSPGRFSLVIYADGKEVVRHEFSDQQRKPVPLAVDVANVRRLTIELLAGDGQDIGDQLNLCDARFTK